MQSRNRILALVALVLFAPAMVLAQSTSFANLFDKDAHGFTGNAYDAEAIAKEIEGYLKSNNYTIEDGILTANERMDFNEYIVNSGGHRYSIILAVDKQITGGYFAVKTFSNPKGERTTYPLFFRNDSLIIGEAYSGKARSGKGKEFYVTAFFEVPFDMLRKIRIVKKAMGPLVKIQYIIFLLNDTGIAHVSNYTGQETYALIFCAPGFDKKGSNYAALQQLVPGIEIVNED